MMRKIVRNLLCLVMVAGMPGLVAHASDKLTTVGVIDVDAIFASYYEESEAVRNYEKAKEEVQNTLKVLSQELVKLNEAKLAAQKIANQPEVLRLDKELLAKSRYIRDYRSFKEQELQAMKTEMSKPDDFMMELYRAVEYVAISQGFTLVVTAGEKGNVFWYSSQIDITGKVLEQLKRTVR